ncbi:MAG: spore gernimation protein [Peptococcaceae bacterium]|nr:MAG: spore gernimation protein [Peptococcaceae bacterium]
MLEEGRIDGRQAGFLLFTLFFAGSLLFVPVFPVFHAGQDAWLSIILAAAGGMVMARLVVDLSLRFPGRTLFQFPEIILGKAAGKAVALLYLWWFFQNGTENYRVFISFLQVSFMPETPLMVFMVFGLTMAAYGAYYGLEVIARTNQLFLPFVLVSVVGLFLLSVPEMTVNNLLPVFEASMIHLVKSAAAPLAWFGEIITLAVLIPYLNRPQQAHRVALFGILGSAAIFEITVIGIMAIFSPALTTGYLFPVLNGARIIHLANFLERMELVLVVMWTIAGVMRVSLLHWVLALGSAQLLGLKDYRPLILPVGVILAALFMLIHKGVLEEYYFLAWVWPLYSLIIFEAGLPLLLLVVAALRGLGGKPA